MRTDIAFELWRSEQNKKEIHFFVKDEQNTYILGINPEFITLKEALTLLANKGFKFPTGAESAWL